MLNQHIQNYLEWVNLYHSNREFLNKNKELCIYYTNLKEGKDKLTKYQIMKSMFGDEGIKVSVAFTKLKESKNMILYFKTSIFLIRNILKNRLSPNEKKTMLEFMNNPNDFDTSKFTNKIKGLYFIDPKILAEVMTIYAFRKELY
jgi:hypothetical protein